MKSVPFLHLGHVSMTKPHITAMRKGNMKMKKIINENYFTPSFTSPFIPKSLFFILITFKVSYFSSLFILQGFNRIAAITLLFMHEEDAFWCLVFIIEHLMPVDYYSRDKQLIGAQVDQVNVCLK